MSPTPVHAIIRPARDYLTISVRSVPDTELGVNCVAAFEFVDERDREVLHRDVRPIKEVDDGFEYSVVSEVIKVTIEPQ